MKKARFTVDDYVLIDHEPDFIFRIVEIISKGAPRADPNERPVDYVKCMPVWDLKHDRRAFNFGYIRKNFWTHEGMREAPAMMTLALIANEEPA